jgi:PncC family amidohydrolase
MTTPRTARSPSDDPGSDEPAGASTLLTTWGLAPDDLHAALEAVRGSDPLVNVAVVGDDLGAPLVRVAVAPGPETDRRLGLAVAAVEGVLGDAVISTDGRGLDEVTVDLAAARGITIGAAESLTSGLIASRLAEPPGGGEVFCGGLVAYSSGVKRRLLGVPPGPVVSAEAAETMAEGICRLLGVDAGLASTGVAGPEPQDGQPVGTVFVGVCLGGRTRVINASRAGSRPEIRRHAASAAVNELRLRLLATA